MATAANSARMRSAPGAITVAMRSVRQALAVPPKRRRTPSRAPTRWGKLCPSLKSAAQPPGMRERADQDVGLLAPGGLGQLPPVQLQLVAGLVVDLDRRRLLAGAAGQAGRAQRQPAQLAHQGRVGALEAERDQLAEQHAGEHVVVVGEAGAQVVAVGLQAAGRPLALGAIVAQIGANGLAVTAGVAGDGRDRPPPSGKCVDLHVVLLCEHPPGPPVGSQA